MILIDRPRPRGAPWRGGVSSLLISDQSPNELFDFAERLRLRLSWYRHRLGGVPFYELTAGQWKAAVAAGAQPVSARELREGMSRWRQRNLN